MDDLGFSMTTLRDSLDVFCLIQSNEILPSMKNIQYDPSPVVGFVTAPEWLEPAITEFPTTVQENIRVRQSPLMLPGFDYQLDSIANVQDQLNLTAQNLEAMGCHLVAQVGTPFAWAGTNSEAEARARCDEMQQVSGVPCVMTSLAMVDGLRARGVNKIAINCPYYEQSWRDQFSEFMRQCDFQVIAAANLHDLGLVQPQESLTLYHSPSEALIYESFQKLDERAPEAEAIVVPGTAVRTLSILQTLEKMLDKPVITADTILYWAIAQQLGLTLKPIMGTYSHL